MSPADMAYGTVDHQKYPAAEQSHHHARKSADKCAGYGWFREHSANSRTEKNTEADEQCLQKVVLETDIGTNCRVGNNVVILP